MRSYTFVDDSTIWQVLQHFGLIGEYFPLNQTRAFGLTINTRSDIQKK
tara:strand:- start:463 stop:606 length:144 start_codon:yes stop_codon:yes gene_type:complete